MSKQSQMRWGLLAVALLIGGLYAAQEHSAEKSELRESLGGRKYKFTPWTGDQESEAGAACRRRVASNFGSYDSRRECFARSFCACATRNYQGRETSYTEFMDLLPAIASYGEPGKYGYVCTGRAEDDCPEPRQKKRYQDD